MTVPTNNPRITSSNLYALSATKLMERITIVKYGAMRTNWNMSESDSKKNPMNVDKQDAAVDPIAAKSQMIDANWSTRSFLDKTLEQ